MLNADDQGRVCKDIPESACAEQPGNVAKHVVALGASKIADGFIDPKLILSWLLGALGAPALYAGLLVPVREAGALLPQLFTAGHLRSLPKRKWAWAAGAVGQGLSAIVIGLAALSLEGAAAGAVIVCALAALALSRSVCSVAYKDVLGKTVSKSKRGSTTGLAASLASVAVIALAATLVLGAGAKMTIVLAAVFAAGGLWVVGGAVFTLLSEAPGATDGGGNAFKEAVESFGALGRDGQLRLFIASRALLTATAFAPPFMVAAALSEDRDGGASLGLLVLASAASSLLSSFVWGALADRSSRLVLAAAAGISAAALAATATLAGLDRLHPIFALPPLLFVLMIAYQGVRLGRSTHLVDMADEETRATYTALSNTVIGVVLMAGAGFGLAAERFGQTPVLAALSLMCALALPVALALEEVQAD
ncbi:MAG: MFS transporter [Pseudomonadota bacterium]